MYFTLTYSSSCPTKHSEIRTCNFDNNKMDSHPELTEADDEFQFETDHLALRGNKDYSQLLKYIVSLEVQRIKALKDVDTLAEAQNNALEEPFEFVKSLQEGTLNFPHRQTILEPPQIDWSKYGIDNLIESEDITNIKPTESELQDATTVRGRTFNDSKPETFNQLWSCEEQRRLEELLEIYPEEVIEAQRYKKIAQALGTRTPSQVNSRIQKYFFKLAKAGLPIPGRLPRKALRDQKRYQNIFYKKSTFFPHLNVPVKMEDPHEGGEMHAEALRSDPSKEDAGLELLKAAKQQRLLDQQYPVWQEKAMCVGCLKTGFFGARWTDNAGTDYCTDCIVQLLPIEKLTPVRKLT